jgi:hypothetical protein
MEVSLKLVIPNYQVPFVSSAQCSMKYEVSNLPNGNRHA